MLSLLPLFRHVHFSILYYHTHNVHMVPWHLLSNTTSFNQPPVSYIPSPSLTIPPVITPYPYHTVSSHTIIHAVHIPAIKPLPSSKTPFAHVCASSISHTLTTNIHIISTHSHILFSFLTLGNSLHFPIKHFIQPHSDTQFPLLITIYFSIPHYHTCSLYLFAPTNRYTSHFPQHHTHTNTLTLSLLPLTCLLLSHSFPIPPTVYILLFSHTITHTHSILIFHSMTIHCVYDQHYHIHCPVTTIHIVPAFVFSDFMPSSTTTQCPHWHHYHI